MNRVLDVRWGGRPVGRLVQDRHGDIAFAYAAEWLRGGGAPALSVSLPLREAPYSRRECRPFFAGLLPEERQREAAARVLGVSPGNDFALLRALGGDVAGALEIVPPDSTAGAPDAAGKPEILDAAGLVRVLDTLPARPLLAGSAGLRLSLAGAQSKLPAVLAGGAVALPAAGQPTTHVLKPSNPRFPALAENEAFAMRLAAAVGLDAAPVELRAAGGRRFLLATRYDRATAADGTVRRVHQEDFCQALGIAPERKYAGEGGPAFRDCFALLRRVAARPAVEVPKLLDAAVINLVVGNADAHGKNFSLLHDSGGPRLAPLYDPLATAAYPEFSPQLAMRIGGGATLAEVDSTAWARFAGDAGLDPPPVRRRAAELAERAAACAGEVAGALAAPGLDEAALDRFAGTVADRAQRCLNGLRR